MAMICEFNLKTKCYRCKNQNKNHPLCIIIVKLTYSSPRRFSEIPASDIRNGDVRPHMIRIVTDKMPVQQDSDYNMCHDLCVLLQFQCLLLSHTPCLGPLVLKHTGVCEKLAWEEARASRSAH